MDNEKPAVSPGKRRKQGPPQLRVVFDTSVLYTGSPRDLVREEIIGLISSNKYPDLEITWYLPEVVRHERQYQMQAEALKLLPHIAKVEKLLGHNLNITEEILKDSVEKAVTRHISACGLTSLVFGPDKVDWHRLISDATYRRPPFKVGENEKGFRDAIVLESLLQLVGESPKTPKVCRVAFVSGDAELREAARNRTQGAQNVVIFENVEEIKGFINTLVSAVDEDFIAQLKPKAANLFFVSKDDKETFFYKENIRGALTKKFAAELNASPAGATGRSNGTWLINSPNFAKKQGRRIYWASRIEIECEAKKSVVQEASPQLPGLRGFGLAQPLGSTGAVTAPPPPGPLGLPEGATLGFDWTKLAGILGATREVTTHKGRDIYEVLWSAEVTTAKGLRRPKIEEIKHVELTWEST